MRQLGFELAIEAQLEIVGLRRALARAFKSKVCSISTDGSEEGKSFFTI
jgi:hypothetical protein